MPANTRKTGASPKRKPSRKVKWETPPENKTGRRVDDWMRDFALILKDNPGRWGVYREGLNHITDITTGKRRFPEIRWISRKMPNGKITIYGIYEG